MMIKISDIKIPYKDINKPYPNFIAKHLRIHREEIKECKLIRRSLDARKPNDIRYVCTFTAKLQNEKKVLKKQKHGVSLFSDEKYSFPFSGLSSEKRPVIIGSGPSGLFCALMLARAGLKPILAERGEQVEDRRKSVDCFWDGGALNLNSNVQFGEGGAGTFSDGKLTCGVHDNRTQFILEEFVLHGAPQDISINAKPHIGTDYLADTVKAIREEIIRLGGTFLFNTLFQDMVIQNGRIQEVILQNVRNGKTQVQKCDALICAIGHSARDTYKMLSEKGCNMIRKPFSIGVRIEHKREFINQIQYREAFSEDALPAADYKLACHLDCGSAYTFCMCPGGNVVASASEEKGVVTNGMSTFARDAENSNSALLVSVLPSDIPGEGIAEAIEFQRDMEKAAFIAGGSNYFAPCQRVGDFLAGIASKECGNVSPSYRPGVKYTDLSKILPEFVTVTLKRALTDFGQKMKGFDMEDALLTGVETRSSAPIRIVRNADGQSNIHGIYPIGEGAGYAGGIMSSAIDGIKCAELICSAIKQ